MLYEKINLLFFILILLLMSCSQKAPSLSQDEAEKLFVGEYELFVGSNQKVYKEDFSTSKLTLLNNGKSIQMCEKKNGKAISLRSNWHYSSGDVCFDKFNDCAGAWGAADYDVGACLKVEFNTPPIILLAADINVFYRRVVEP